MIKTFHSGDNIVFNAGDVIGIFNLSRGSEFLLEKAAENFLIRNDSQNKKSFILVNSEKKTLIYYSALRAGNLIKRFNASQEDI